MAGSFVSCYIDFYMVACLRVSGLGMFGVDDHCRAGVCPGRCESMHGCHTIPRASTEAIVSAGNKPVVRNQAWHPCRFGA